jgi:NADH-quinone oxidoreductase E subunit
VLSEKARAEILRIRDEYPDPRSALLPALHLAQADHGGWLPEAAYDDVAQVMELSPTLVASVASFYSMLYRRPVGQHTIQVCTNISCSLAGAQPLLEYLSRKLGIEPGETSPDGRFSLLEVECLGSCGTAPAMQVNDTYYENLTKARIDEILANLTQKENDR